MTIEIPLSRGRVTLIDEADVPFVSQHKWSYHPRGYAVRTVRLNGKQRTIYLHRALLNPPDDLVVDHINGDPLDNRRDNLRLATPWQNTCNGPLQSNRHGYRGVTESGSGKFVAAIKVHHRRYQLGSYNDPYTASLVYDVAARHFHGDFATLNHPDQPIHYTARQYFDRALHTHKRGPKKQPYKVEKRPSRYRYVYWQAGRWRALFRHQGKNIHAGYFEDERAAAYAVDRVILQHRGPNADINLPLEREHHLRILAAQGLLSPTE